MSVNSKMTAIADAIRLKTGGTKELTLDQMAEDLNAIPERTAVDVITNGMSITVPAGNYQSSINKSVSLPSVSQATPRISINNNGLITATASQQSGYVQSGVQSVTHQLAFQSAKTITPTLIDQTAVASGYYTGGSIIVKGDANLKAENIAQGVTIFGVSGTCSSGNITISGTTNEDNIVTGALTSYYNNRVSTIRNYAFYAMSTLSSVSFTKCTTIGIGAFANCSKLTSINFPSCTTIGSSAFSGCDALSIANFSKCTVINNDAFYKCSKLSVANFPACLTIKTNGFSNCFNLTTISFPVCSIIYNYGFARCSKLATANFPQCKIVNQDAFYYCSNLTDINLPICSTLGSWAFMNCQALTTVTLPQCTIIGSLAFSGCSKLTTLSFPAGISIYSSAFYKCTNLSAIYLPGSQICALLHSNAFSSTGITNSTGSIYVPLSLGVKYKTATNWTYFFDRIFSIEGEEIVVKSINFTIDNISYVTMANTNWEYWVNSENNIDGFKIRGLNVISANEDVKVNDVQISDIIQENGVYTTVPMPQFGEPITFYISYYEHGALDGMTWSDWVESEYNTSLIYDEIYIDSTGTKVCVNNEDNIIVDEDYISISPDDLIVANAFYDIGFNDGGGH